MSKTRVSLPDAVGGGYKDYWNFKGRYRVVKGSRASKKSKTAALWFISSLIKYQEANLLVIRKVHRTLKDSCYTELKWAIRRLGLEAYFLCQKSPLEITYLPTGQKIYFRGLDDPLKITSITVETGYLCWCWIEEAYEISREADFDTLDESIRGEVSEGLFKQITLTFNPWNERHWLKKRFFDHPSPDILAKTTNYLCNEFLDDADRQVFEKMKERPKRYRVAGLGEWGIVEGLVYENWEEQAFDKDEIAKRKGIQSAFGMDFGFSNSYTTLFCGLVDKEKQEIYVFDELYKQGLTNKMIARELKRMGYAKESIIADCAEPKSIVELRNELGIARLEKSRKGKDSINNGIQYIQNYKIIVHPRCVNFLREIGNYTWSEDRQGTRLNVPIDEHNHLMDAMRYALEKFNKGKTFSWE